MVFTDNGTIDIDSLQHATPGPVILGAKNGVLFRVWAPDAQEVDLVLDNTKETIALSKDEAGYFSAIVNHAGPGTRYGYRLDGGPVLPDPASRFQPEGVLGPSEVLDVSAFTWNDQAWRGLPVEGQVLYELHIGTFTQQGTYRAAAEHLPYLKELGITTIELMPVNSFAGRFGWGYDGVLLYAPFERYGRPEDLAGFINRAHHLGLAVILDVVYNHLGPTGNVLPQYSKHYFSQTVKTDWGDAINFDGERSGPVRAFFRENAVHWIRDFHFDGLRIDATQDIHDHSREHILGEITEAGRKAAGNRRITIVGENEPQQVRLLQKRQEGGCNFDALWNDDFHHSAMVALTGKSDAYYSDHRGSPQEFISAMKYGYLYQGQWYSWQNKNRGTSTLGEKRSSFVNYIQNHDQVANSAWGARAHQVSSPGRLKALTAVMLLAPGTPMLFQGQEYAAEAPFLYFADHCFPGPDGRPLTEELADGVRAGRRSFIAQWKCMKDPELDAYLADPCLEETFHRCKLTLEDCKRRREWYDLHADLLRMRREDPVFSAQARWGLDGAVLAAGCFAVRYFSPQFRDDRLLLVNLGTELVLSPLPEPLLAPPGGSCWQILWSSEHPRYRGNGVAPVIEERGWRIPGEAAIVLHPVAELKAS